MYKNQPLLFMQKNVRLTGTPTPLYQQNWSELHLLGIPCLVTNKTLNGNTGNVAPASVPRVSGISLPLIISSSLSFSQALAVSRRQLA